MIKKKYLQELIEEELKKNASSDETDKKDEDCPSKKSEDDNLEEKNKSVKSENEKSSETPDDEKKDDDLEENKKKSESEEDKGNDDKSDDSEDSTDKKTDMKNEAVEQLIGMIESGLPSQEIAERIFKVTQESVLEAVNQKTETLEESIEEKYAAILESQISELEKEFASAAKDIVLEKIKVVESEYKDIVKENENYQEAVDNILSISKDFDEQLSKLEEDNKELKSQNQILENTIVFNEKTKNFALSDVDRINTVVSEESYSLDKKEFEKLLETAFEKFDLTEETKSVEDKKSSEVSNAQKMSEECMDIIKSATALKNKTIWF